MSSLRIEGRLEEEGGRKRNKAGRVRDGMEWNGTAHLGQLHVVVIQLLFHDLF